MDIAASIVQNGASYRYSAPDAFFLLTPYPRKKRRIDIATGTSVADSRVVHRAQLPSLSYAKGGITKPGEREPEEKGS